MYDILELNKKLLPELRDIAKGLQIKRVEALKKQDLIYKILDQQAIENAVPKKIEPKEPKKFLVASSSATSAPAQSSSDEAKDRPRLRERIKIRDTDQPQENNLFKNQENGQSEERKRVFPRIKFLDKKPTFKKEGLVDTDALNIDTDDEDFPPEPIMEAAVGEEPIVSDTSEKNADEQIKVNTGFEIKIDLDFCLQLFWVGLACGLLLVASVGAS